MKTLALIFILSLSTASYAQSTKELEVLFQKLQSESPSVRAYARQALGDAGPAVIPDMMRELALNDSEYRTRLGIAVGLIEMVTEDNTVISGEAGERAQISAQLTGDDIARLVSYVADQDRTIRIYVTDFLLWLRDPRVVQAAIKLAAQFNGESRRVRQIQYNLIVVAKNSFIKMKQP